MDIAFRLRGLCGRGSGCHGWLAGIADRSVGGEYHVLHFSVPADVSEVDSTV